jgi:hypothetical protein
MLKLMAGIIVFDHVWLQKIFDHTAARDSRASPKNEIRGDAGDCYGVT